MKKRKAWRVNDDDDEFFEKYNPTDIGAGTEHGQPENPFEDNESNVAEAMTPAPAGAYPDRQIHYGDVVDHVVYDTYDVGYPPGTGYQPDHPYAESSSTPTPTGNYSPTNAPNTSYSGLPPPVSFRDPGARGSGYDQSIDSFYGVSGAEEPISMAF
jgi:hypothetical protein